MEEIEDDMERKRIRLMALLIIVAALGILEWYFDWFHGPAIVSTVVL